MENQFADGVQHAEPQRDDGGGLLLEQYGARGDGRSVALIGLDGPIDWWCVPQMDSPPLFDRLLAPHSGGFFSITVLYAGWALGDYTRRVNLPGYKNSPPVVGNDARDQLQHGVFGDIFETARCFIDSGNILDSPSAMLLAGLADQYADCWRQADAGIWELQETRHYTMSKISCWQALSRAIELADGGHLPTTCRERWDRERQRIQAWIEQHCWSERRQAYVFYPGTDRLDASVALAVRIGYPSPKRLRSTLEAVQVELGAGAFHYRYSQAYEEEGCFLACTFWIIEAWALLGECERGESALHAAVKGLEHGVGIYSEMIDPSTGNFLGNLPQGLTHLAAMRATLAISGYGPER